MDVFEAIWTTRAMRHLDSAREVSDEDLWKILEAASKGPGRGTANKFLVVKDPVLRREVGELYRGRWSVVGQRIRETGFTPRSGDWLGEHFGEAAVIIVAVAPPAAEASIYNQIQNLFLAARALGLGTTLTTATGSEGYVDGLRSLLKIPEDQAIFAVIPLGYPTGRWAEAPRPAIESLVFWDRWENVRTRTEPWRPDVPPPRA